MTVEVLRLAGLDVAAAAAAAAGLLWDMEQHPNLSRTLVIDDTAALVDHTGVYQRLLTSARLKHLLCVALGPLEPPGPDGRNPRIRIPANISSRLGSAVLWVSNPRGIDWELSASAIADGHAGSPVSGLDHLVKALSVDEVFDQVLVKLVSGGVRNGVASPGLWLAGADDEAASFAAALALAIDRLTGPGSGLAAGAEKPFAELIPGSFGTVGLAEGGELAAYRDRIVGAVASTAGALAKPRGGLLRRGGPDVGDRLNAICRDLRAFRDRVAQLFTEAESGSDLSEGQRRQVTAAGIMLPDPPVLVDPQPGRQDANRSAVPRLAVEALRSGDTAPQVTKRLNLTGQQLIHKGSASYLPEVTKTCPVDLIDQPGPREPWLQDAARAADGLAALVVTVARKEWSGGAAVADEITRIRIALDGIAATLVAQASQDVPVNAGGVRGSRLARLSDSLLPILCDLVGAALATEAATPSAGGQEAYERAQARTGDLLTEWRRHADQNGPTAPPPFVRSVVPDHAYADDNMTAIREALLHDPHAQMWQLCGPDDLSALNVRGSLQVVAFAPRMAKEALGVPPPPETTWIRSGYAGLIRLVPLRDGAVQVEWTDRDGSAHPDDRDDPDDTSAEP
jgi:hypothetical protein